MKRRSLRCDIEALSVWHPHFYVEPYVVSFVAVTGQYSISPASFLVECRGVESPWLANAREFSLQVSWTEETIEKAERLRATMPARSLVEFAAVAMALVLVHKVVPLGTLNVMQYGDRADYRSMVSRRVLEVSGTETFGDLKRRHREKMAQALANPLRWDALVVVCAFCRRSSRHHVGTSVGGATACIKTGGICILAMLRISSRKNQPCFPRRRRSRQWA